ncbi:CLUMA_CG006920, isoform A [Clunio marinus]|uniref:CLUMA_CG006920, isoform A n=1 Tax=Clunio marinus TaxID=568069 RepID=A0A1J1HZ56_9DIPT|nr:CLUMA_CG006920, isoform A [Clunio marinus]
MLTESSIIYTECTRDLTRRVHFENIRESQSDNNFFLQNSHKKVVVYICTINLRKNALKNV